MCVCVCLYIPWLCTKREAVICQINEHNYHLDFSLEIEFSTKRNQRLKVMAISRGWAGKAQVKPKTFCSRKQVNLLTSGRSGSTLRMIGTCQRDREASLKVFLLTKSGTT